MGTNWYLCAMPMMANFFLMSESCLNNSICVVENGSLTEEVSYFY